MFCFSICIALFTASFFSDVGAVTASSAAEEVDQLIEMVHGSDDCCWSRVNHKKTMIQKLNAVQGLIEDGNYADAYNKMLHDIKPKLTGLKTDESEEPWANHQYGGCMFHLAWVECEQLREEFWLKCNTIL